MCRSFKCVVCRLTPTTNIFFTLQQSHLFFIQQQYCHKHVEIYQSNPSLTRKCWKNVTVLCSPHLDFLTGCVFCILKKMHTPYYFIKLNLNTQFNFLNIKNYEF